MKKKSKLRMLFLWGCFIIVSIISWWFLRPRLTAEVFIVKRGRAISAVYGTVGVEPIIQTIVRSQSEGIVASIKVKTGEIVKQGQTLAEVSDETAKLQIQQVLNELEIEKQRHQIGPSSAPTAKVKRSQLEQLEKLLRAGNIARSEYERNLSELQTLEERMKTEQLALNAALQTAEQKLAASSSLDKQRFSLSPQDGIILDIYAQLGEVITPRAQMFLIGSSSCHLKAQVNEEDVGSLKNGMKAIVKLYSYPNFDFKATLQEVLPKGDNQSYHAILTLDEPPERLLPGMTGELNIIIGVRENALIIPTRAIRAGNTVLLVEHGIVRKRSVEIGYRNIEKAEIREGLKEEDHIILSDHDLFKVGQLVNEHIRKIE